MIGRRQEAKVTEKPVKQGEAITDQGAPALRGRHARTGLAGTLIALQALIATGAGANTLSINRAEEIRDKMARSDPATPLSRTEAPVRQAQWPNWGSWGNWGNWPGWLPRKLQKWRWPRA
jgi:hypothetical protein